MSTEKKATGLFGVKVSENDGPEETIPTTEHSLDIQTDRLTVSGFVETPQGRRGVQIDIHGELKLGTHPFTENYSTAGFYNPHGQTSSWVGRVKGGAIVLLEVDVEKQFARGTFEFVAEDRHNPNSAKVIGSFSLTG
ncbi:hypothetical protein [Pseudomonas sp. TWP3-2]|uniref:hypothetical protein n=1 Tax=Pseudomonas sp. TWP3-2 TaxID=2804574 RepID=UPI003CEA88D2